MSSVAQVAHPRYEWGLKLAVSVTFCVAAIGKILDISAFQRELAAIDWLPDRMILPGAIVLILAEFLGGALLLVRKTERVGLVITSALSASFLLTRRRESLWARLPIAPALAYSSD